VTDRNWSVAAPSCPHGLVALFESLGQILPRGFGERRTRSGSGASCSAAQMEPHFYAATGVPPMMEASLRKALNARSSIFVRYRRFVASRPHGRVIPTALIGAAGLARRGGPRSAKIGRSRPFLPSWCRGAWVQRSARRPVIARARLLRCPRGGRWALQQACTATLCNTGITGGRRRSTASELASRSMRRLLCLFWQFLVALPA